MLFLKDNAPAHQVAIVQRFLLYNNFEEAPHAPYSPDLSGFSPFPTPKETLSGRTLSSHAALASAICSGETRPLKKCHGHAIVV